MTGQQRQEGDRKSSVAQVPPALIGWRLRGNLSPDKKTPNGNRRGNESGCIYHSLLLGIVLTIRKEARRLCHVCAEFDRKFSACKSKRLPFAVMLSTLLAFIAVALLILDITLQLPRP